jgi:hypothetical protein
MPVQVLDSFSIPAILIGFAVASLVIYEVGFRLGRWWQERMPGEQEGPTGVLVGALLGLMAFLLAVTMGLAADRFDARRGLVVEEANAISRTYLEADYLTDPEAGQMRELLREYVPLRIVSEDLGIEGVQANLRRSTELHAEMWAIAARVARSGHSPDLVSSFGDSLTEVVNLNERRVVSGVYARVPETVLVLLLVGSVLALGMVGYSAGIAGRRSVLGTIVLIVALGAVLTLVIDLDRPQQGLLRVSQQALVDLQQLIGPPSN